MIEYNYIVSVKWDIEQAYNLKGWCYIPSPIPTLQMCNHTELLVMTFNNQALSH